MSEHSGTRGSDARSAAYELRWLADMLDKGRVERFTAKWDGVGSPEIVVVLGGEK